MCVLSEHLLYTQTLLHKHLKEGDFDEMGNLYFYHPFCGFCKVNFYAAPKRGVQ